MCISPMSFTLALWWKCCQKYSLFTMTSHLSNIYYLTQSYQIVYLSAVCYSDAGISLSAS